MAGAGAGVAALSLMAASCDTTTGAGVQGTPSGGSPTSSPTSSVHILAIGQTEATTTGDSYTLVAYKAAVASNNEFNTPPAGGRFAAADVKLCAGSAGLLANPTDFAVGFADASQVSGGDASLLAVPGATLSLGQVQPGQCVSGWVSFTIPTAAPATKVLLSNSDFYWSVPG
ncbi:MAG: hypothetical protein ACRENL_01480 [Candidatus Dormibacteria bacterium]